MIMLDEPSAALAPQIVIDIFRTIHRITRDGMTVLMVEQNVRMALLLAEYGYVIKDGVIHIEGPAEKMIHDDNVRLSYLGGTAPSPTALAKRQCSACSSAAYRRGPASTFRAGIPENGSRPAPGRRTGDVSTFGTD